MDVFVSSSGVWKKISSAFVSSGGVWKKITDGYVSSGGVWKKFFQSAVSPSIAQTVEISRNNATYPSTLTGRNYRWTDSTSITYVFQKSADNSSWTNIGTATSIANPSVGSSNTVTYALTLADMPAYTSYYRFVVTAVNSTYSTSTTSTSTSVSVNQPAPVNNVAPVVSPSSGTVGVTTYSTTNGTWDPDDADGIYAYQWQYNDQGSTFVSISGATSSTYSPPSNFLSIYVSPIRCRVTATNASGSTAAFSNQVTVSAAAPTGGSVSISPSGTQVAGTTLTVSTSGWSGSPTSYNVRLYASTSNPPSDGGVGSILKTSTSSSSLTYTITTSDAQAPAYYFKAFATATNAGGTSTQVESNVVLSSLPPAPSGGSVTLSPSGNQFDGTTLTASTFGWSGSPTSYSLRLYASTSNPPSAGGVGSVLITSTTSTSLTYTITSGDATPPAYYFKAFASATNTGGTSSDAESNVVLSVLRTVPGTVNSLSATSSLSGSNLNWSASWSAPSNNGGASITGYRVYVERAGSSSGPWIASTTQIPAGSGAFTQSSPYFTSSTSVSGRVTGTAATWIRVWVAAVNSIGTGSYVSAVG
jgi:hypothetical protein